MSRDRTYSTASEIEATLGEIDGVLQNEATVYLLGGGAMTLEELKGSTEDIDLLAPTNGDYRHIREALLDLGFEPRDHTEPDYASLGAASVLKYGDGHVDLFDRQVMSKLTLSDGMRDRSVEIFDGSRLTVHRLSWTDVTLFKSMTPRDADLQDVQDLIARGIDFDVLEAEFEEQVPLNYGLDEYEWVVNEKKQHPIFQLEESFTSIEGFPEKLAERVRQLADVVDAERELFFALRERDRVDQAEFVTEFAERSHPTEEQLREGIDRLEEKDLLAREDGKIELRVPDREQWST